jgi:ssDNA-binding replication factor A large subunit
MTERTPPLSTGTKIRDLREGMSNITLIGRLVRLEQSKVVESRYGTASLTPSLFEDETGAVTLNLWSAQAMLVSAGEKLRLIGCYVHSYGGRLALNVAESGAIQILERT